MSTPAGPGAVPMPSALVIPLPPGMTPASFENLQGSLVTIAITTAVAFSIIIWDYFNLLPDEVKMYRSSNNTLWRTPATWAFIVLRYSGILANFPALFFTSIQSSHCQLAVLLSQVGAVLVVAASGLIFAYRVIAMWDGLRIVFVAVGVMYALMLGCWLAVATKFSASNGPPTPFGSNCRMHDIVSWAPISFASSVAFDSVILFLTLLKLNANLASTSRLGYLIYRDSLLYFLFTAVTNTVVLAIQSQGPSYDLVKPNAVPFSTLVTVTMGSRVFLNLKLFHQRQARLNQGLPSGSQMSNEEYSKNSRRPLATTTSHPARSHVAVAAYPTRSPSRGRDKAGVPYAGYAQTNYELSDRS